jgi:hypothetical protein
MVHLLSEPLPGPQPGSPALNFILNFLSGTQAAPLKQGVNFDAVVVHFLQEVDEGLSRSRSVLLFSSAQSGCDTATLRTNAIPILIGKLHETSHTSNQPRSGEGRARTNVMLIFPAV